MWMIVAILHEQMTKQAEIHVFGDFDMRLITVFGCHLRVQDALVDVPH